MPRSFAFIAFRVLAPAALLAAVTASATDQDQDFSFFEKNVRPVLVEHCYKCHSAESEKIKGGLRLDFKASILKGGDSGPALVPGKPEESLLIKAVRYTDPDLQMPPPKGGNKKLSDSQIVDLTRWVKMGAPDPRVEQAAGSTAKTSPAFYDFKAARESWAFHPPVDPPVPSARNARWAKSPIDRFIFSKLEEKDLSPAKAADKRTLIRRATFDLIGLPPTPTEINEFLADESPNAFSKVVDRLLASPHYGECWARHWLDVVRYTDSLDARIVGNEQDSLDAWRYRDWVVEAFNSDLPYDRFITEQVAGDLLPPAEPDGIDTNAIIATGMYAIGNWGNGDADKDKILTDIADDAVDVTGRAFLGLTLACARCHDHKFDPIPTADYYSMAGIFFSSHILSKLTPKGAGEVLMRIPLISKAEKERRKQREHRMAELEKTIERIQDEQITALAETALAKTTNYLAAAVVGLHTDGLKAEVQTSLNQRLLHRWIDFLNAGNRGLFSQPVKDLLGNKGLSAWRIASGADTPSVVANSTDQEAVFLTIKLAPHHVAIHPSPEDGVAAAWKSPATGSVRITGRVVDADPNCGDGIDWELVKMSGQADTSVAKGSIPNGGTESLAKANGSITCEVKVGDLLQLNVFPKAEYSCDTTMLEWEISEVNGQKRVWNLNGDVADDLLAANPHADRLGNSDVWYFRDLAEKISSDPSDSGLAQWKSKTGEKTPVSREELEAIAAKIQCELLSGKQTNGGYAGFTVPRGAFWAPLRNDDAIYSAESKLALQKTKSELAELRKNPPPPVAMAHGLQDGGVPESPHAGFHDVKIHVRGRYDRLADLVPRRFPRVLAGDNQPPIAGGSGRLQLAKWLTSPQNPLTARVMVNRVWQHHFGEGIVRTPNNYGKLGTPATHPELLDFLAHRFMGSGWSIKSLHRAIMLSAVYQQSSIPEPATFAADPENKLLGRMNRRRLDAEALRDSLLVAAGKLDRTFGGPAVRDLNNPRRTLYLMTIRSDRSNYRALFDAADPTAIVDQRNISIVAPQALFLMNNPFVLDQTKSLSQRVLDSAKSNQDRIVWAYESLYGRPPKAEELRIGLDLLTTPQTEKGDSVNVWLEYCEALLCANEFVYVD